MDHEQSDTEGPRYYSQVAAVAMHRELTNARTRIRQLENLVGILHREADVQAAAAAELREEIEQWRSRYMRACTPEEAEER